MLTEADNYASIVILSLRQFIIPTTKEMMDAHLGAADTSIAADDDFHRTLARATQNDLILTFVDSIVDLLSEQRKHIFSVSGGASRGQMHHKLLLETIQCHNSEAAREAMRAHLQQVRFDVETALAQKDQ